MTSIAVVGSGISGAVCASTLAKNGVSVTLFESARGPGGRMSQRRETCEDGKELLFDHGAPFFIVDNPHVLQLVHDWESKGLVAEWKEDFGSFDFLSNKFVEAEQKDLSKRYVGVPGMNSICKALCNESGIRGRFGTGVGKLEWLTNENSWSLQSFDGQDLGQYKGVVVSDKNIVSTWFTDATGRPPPLDLSCAPELALKLKDIPVYPCFALMLAFAEPLVSMPLKGFSFKNSEVLSWSHCDNVKPGRSFNGCVVLLQYLRVNRSEIVFPYISLLSQCLGCSEQWVLHSTVQYARRVIDQTGLQKPSAATLNEVADNMLREFQTTGLNIPLPFFMKAHRWGSAFPAVSIAGREKCLWDGMSRLAICGDFCVSPNVEGAILSGLAAASKHKEAISCL